MVAASTREVPDFVHLFAPQKEPEQAQDRAPGWGDRWGEDPPRWGEN